MKMQQVGAGEREVEEVDGAIAMWTEEAPASEMEGASRLRWRWVFNAAALGGLAGEELAPFVFFVRDRGVGVAPVVADVDAVFPLVGHGIGGRGWEAERTRDAVRR